MRLRERLAAGGFAVTAEISPPRGAVIGPVGETAALLRDWVDAVNVTDNQGSNARLASWAGSLAALAAGLEPVMQMTCRDRNRIALQSDLLGASALGIRNVLVMTGDHPKFGDHPAAKPVFDLDSVQLLWALRHMRDQGALLSGRPLRPPPDCFLGAVENPFAPPASFRAERLGKKVDAGAQFVQTQYVFDVAVFARWMAQVRTSGAPSWPGWARSGPGGRSTSSGTRCRGWRYPTTCTAGCARSRRTGPPPRAPGWPRRPSPSSARSRAWPGCTC